MKWMLRKLYVYYSYCESLYSSNLREVYKHYFPKIILFTISHITLSNHHQNRNLRYRTENILEIPSSTRYTYQTILHITKWKILKLLAQSNIHVQHIDVVTFHLFTYVYRLLDIFVSSIA